jgi:hypothetical protein
MKPWWILAGLACATPVAAQTWSLEAFGGNAYNFDSRLRIAQDGGFGESLTAKYETRGFRPPLYYQLRAGHWSGERAWEISLLHHKIYLANPPAGVSDVSVSHGFNIVSVNRAFRAGDWTYRFGAGPVITHAEATILGAKYDGPYRLSGAALLTAAGRRFYVGTSTYVTLEGALTAAYAKPRLAGTPSAELNVTNFAAHALIGVGHEL